MDIMYTFLGNKVMTLKILKDRHDLGDTKYRTKQLPLQHGKQNTVRERSGNTANLGTTLQSGVEAEDAPTLHFRVAQQ